MKNRIEYILFILFSWCFRLLGINLSRKFATILAFVFFYLIPIRKKVVFNNLKIAFPENDSQTNKKLAFRIYLSFAITLVEILYLPYIKKEKLINEVMCSNPELIIEKFKEGKGLILLSSHFGNWEFGAISIALQVHLPFSVIVKPLRNPLVYEWMNNFRTKFGNEVVPLGISIRKTYQTLKQKKVVAMVADQRGPIEGVKLDFFGKKVSVYTGPAALALKTGAPLICGIAVRQKDYKYKMDLVEISQQNLPDGEEEKILEISQRYTSYLEKVIRENPEQWLWMHNRWKH
ncbi:MAG TPA: lysophospholipid acyltransferase family protein [Ignavibacteriaceae bacterium]|nr:lysophospholipid acyltransferase family protein [Ignavibacteriaceae bacterium]